MFLPPWHVLPPTPLFSLFKTWLFPQIAMWMFLPASREVGSPEQEKQLGENRIILSTTILVYSNWRRMASDWHNWFPFQTPQSKACISPFVSSGTALPPAAADPTCQMQLARLSCNPLGCCIWRRRTPRRGEEGVPPCWGRAELPSLMEPHTPTLPPLEPFVVFLALWRDLDASCCH